MAVLFIGHSVLSPPVALQCKATMATSGQASSDFIAADVCFQHVCLTTEIFLRTFVKSQ
jgi:hypothetical protein